MCGIAGFSGDFDTATLAALGAAIAHRGPDAAGHGAYGAGASRAGLVNRRLAIQDLSAAGHQPMTLRCPACLDPDAPADQRLWLTYNGEIYNAPELRRELERAGHRFSSRADTEVILHLYAQHGPGMLRLLNGIFALAIYDGRPRGQPAGLAAGDVLLARDGVGVKPLYYAESRRGILFASEMKALLQQSVRDVNRALDPAALDQYLTFQWVPAPRTVVAGVRKVLPGECLILRRGRVASRSTFYHLPVVDPLNAPLEALVEEFRRELRDAVQRQLLSDVPVGAFLSGGLDSSAVVAMARQARPDSRLPCYTMAFDEDFALEGGPSDLPYARDAARHLGVELIEVHAGTTVVDRLEEVLWALDEPAGDPAPMNAYLIAERARADGLKVLLSGTGGDDLLAGYPRHLGLGLETLVDVAPLVLRRRTASYARAALDTAARTTPAGFAARRILKLLARADRSRAERLAARLQTTEPALRSRLLEPSIRASVPDGCDLAALAATLGALPPEADSLTAMLQLEQRHFLADHNLPYLDKMTMAFGVEGRVPLLDLRFVEFAARIPSRYKLSGVTGKYILRKAMEPLLPTRIVNRPKAGFGVPLRRWVARELRARMRDTLSPGAVRRRGVFDVAAVQQLINDTERGRADGAYPLYSLLAFETWCRQMLDATASPTDRTIAAATSARG